MPPHQKARLHFLLYYPYCRISVSNISRSLKSEKRSRDCWYFLKTVWSFVDAEKSTILLKSLRISSLCLLKVNSAVVPGMIFATSPFSNVKTYSHSVSSRSLWKVLNLLIASWSSLLYDSFVLTFIATLLPRTGFKYNCFSLLFSIPMLIDTHVNRLCCFFALLTNNVKKQHKRLTWVWLATSFSGIRQMTYFLLYLLIKKKTRYGIGMGRYE